MFYPLTQRCFVDTVFKLSLFRPSGHATGIAVYISFAQVIYVTLPFQNEYPKLN